MQPISIDKYFDRLIHWLKLEADAERERLAERRQRFRGAEAERHGETLLDLAVDDHDSGLGGRYLLTFVKRNRTLGLPWNRFRVGSPVVVSSQSDDYKENYSGVVSRRNNEAIQVSLDEWPDGDVFRMDMSPDEVTRLRQNQAIALSRTARGRLAQIRDVLLIERSPKFFESSDMERAAAYPKNKLNPSQNEAIRFALSALDLAIIHGPPGTGKTTTVVELIKQAVARSNKVLAAAPSNTAVDNMLERLIATGVRVVRLGHPARVHESLHSHTLDGLVEQDSTSKIIKDMMRESERLIRSATRFTRAKPAKGEKQEIRRAAKQLRDEARLLERNAIQHILDRADVICATTTFDREILGDRKFELVVIDEACQSTEPGCWPVITLADRIVLAGDHCQLPPTVVSTEAAREGFSISMMERLIDRFGTVVTRRLDTQYRMNDKIMQFSSQQFYDASLIADSSVAEHRLSDISQIAPGSMLDEPVSYIDTAGASWDEELEPDGESRLNRHEADLILKKAGELCDAGISPCDIAIIAPYAAQVRWLREHCHQRAIEIDTVDGFQGREKEVVLITLVRSNDTGEIGFLGDTRRMNVAMTRAKRKLIVIGDSATLGSNSFYSAFLEYVETIGAYHTVWDEGM